MPGSTTAPPTNLLHKPTSSGAPQGAAQVQPSINDEYPLVCPVLSYNDDMKKDVFYHLGILKIWFSSQSLPIFHK